MSNEKTFNSIPDRPDNWSMADEGYEKVTKLDYFGQPYDVWQKKKPLNIGQLWEKFKRRLDADQTIRRQVAIIQQDTDLHDSSQELNADKWNERIEQYFYNQLNENV